MCYYPTNQCGYDIKSCLAGVQTILAERVIKEDSLTDPQRIAGVDVSFSFEDQAVAAAVVLDLHNREIVDEATREVELLFPYIPGFLGFRESDAMVSVLKQLNKSFDVLMVNGHGVLHPRGFGLASQVGILLDRPTLGVAKRLIAGSHITEDTSQPKIIKFRNEKVGAGIRGNYVSIGHKISLRTALNLVEKTSIFKTPEPIRQAHILATQTFKQYLSDFNEI